MTFAYRTIVTPGADKESTNLERRWWTLKGDEAAQSIQKTVDLWMTNQYGRVREAVRAVRAYEALPNYPGRGGSLGRTSSGERGEYHGRARVSFNGIQACTDTLHAKACKTMPMPFYLDDDGDFEEHRKAREMTRFNRGVFEENKTYELTMAALKDAELMADGFVHVFPQDGRVKHEKVLAIECFVDEVESRLAHPTQFARVKNVDRDELLARFPEKKFPGAQEAIMGAPREEMLDLVPAPTNSYLVKVIEIWHLRSSRKSQDGAHAIVVNGHLLGNIGRWDHDWFPFAKIAFNPRTVGYWSQSLFEQLDALQYEIDRLSHVITQSLITAGTYKWFAKTGSKIVIEHINNAIGAIWRGEEPPQLLSLANIVPPELYQRLMTLIQHMFEQSGISKMNAISEKPADLESAPALRTFDGFATERFLPLGKRWENFHCEIGRLSIAVARDILGAKNDDTEDAGENDDETTEPEPGEIGYDVRMPAGSRHTIDWKYLELEEGRDEVFALKCFPISWMSSNPAELLDQVQEWVQNGWLDEEIGKELMEFPDTGRLNGLENANREWVSKTLDEIINTGKYTPPDEDMVLPAAAVLTQEYIARGHVRTLPPGRIALLKKFRDDIQTLMGPPKVAAAPPPTPLANPTAAPVSPLLPHAAPAAA